MSNIQFFNPTIVFSLRLLVYLQFFAFACIFAKFQLVARLLSTFASVHFKFLYYSTSFNVVSRHLFTNNPSQLFQINPLTIDVQTAA
jgi:hypothetical protein